MGFEVDAALYNRAVRPDTAPLVLVCWEHSGLEENLSLTGTLVFDSKIFYGGVLTSVTRSGRDSATITLPADSDRVMQVRGHTWRGSRRCCIYEIPADPDTAEFYTTDQGITVLDGIIDSSSQRGGQVVVTAIHKKLSGKYTPRHNFSQVSPLSTAPGTIAGDVALRARR